MENTKREEKKDRGEERGTTEQRIAIVTVVVIVILVVLAIILTLTEELRGHTHESDLEIESAPAATLED